ncbi:hypothetical protein BC939DRAFT_457857 [Gamsiella multidivaricata]|uniref:uncharacterized protein n=1 Tax=Gamsiella multidivaricata TaxID=101098 RepID=UPI00221F68DC|nr:uncharacterized protein BC939DRAFT_457857 [Gamsiella multidivaricata]KAG0355727.1 hypothetical protein BGZ54_001032 [Gamsiella multidivaricata]KAI7820394.1 hypothetical protein BC939DRAFT_457857 [Gamsiella multidivaricata]
MRGTSNARVRQLLTIVCLTLSFIFSLIIMGLVGVNGKITTRSLSKSCLLYISADGDVLNYNNHHCLFPIIGAAVTAVLSLIFLVLWIMIVHRNDEFSPRPISIPFLILSALCALLSFAICGQIGIGLNRGCSILGDESYRCRKTSNFNALWGAEICAGISGGLWVIAMLLELFQFLRKPHGHSTNDPIRQTTVVPHHRNESFRNGATVSPYSTAATPATTHGQKADYNQPQMTQYHDTAGYGSQQV